MRTKEKLGRGIIDVEDLLPRELVCFGPHSEGSHDLDEPLLAQSNDKQKGFALGSDDYVTKPFEVRELDPLP